LSTATRRIFTPAREEFQYKLLLAFGLGWVDAMRRPVQITSSILLVGILGMIAWQVLRPREPEPMFQGKSASYWVRSLGNPDLRWTVEPWMTMGSNGVPYLAKGLELRNSPVGKVFLGLWPHLPKAVTNCLPRPVDARLLRERVAQCLYDWTAGGKLAIPALVQALKDEDASVRGLVAAAVGEIGRTDPDVAREQPGVILALAAVLQDKNAQVRQHTAQSLGEFGRAARPAIPALLNAIQDPDAFVRAFAAAALIDIEPETASRAGAFAFLQKSMAGIDPAMCAAAMEAVAGMRREPLAVVPVLVVKLRQDSDPAIRGEAALNLGKLGKLAQGAVPGLIAALKDSDSKVRGIAAEALKQIDPEAAAKAGVK
jgi:HEAT repeat protein